MTRTRANTGIEKLTFEEASRLLSYDKETGHIKWRIDRAQVVKAGDIAGTLHPTGYIRITIGPKGYPAHRIAYLLETGAWPEEILDHADGNKANNKWENLSAVTECGNMRNKKRRIDCPFLTGVRFHEQSCSWMAHIQADRVPIVKYFKCLLSAVAFRYRMEREFGFSETHGRRIK